MPAVLREVLLGTLGKGARGELSRRLLPTQRGGTLVTN